MVYANDYIKHCYPIQANLMLDYKEQVLITGIKSNMQCSIYNVLPKKKS